MSNLTKDSTSPLAEIAQGPNAFDTFLDRNQKLFIAVVLLIAAGVAAYVIYDGITETKRKSAAADLVKANDLAALQKVASEHPQTPAAASAAILLADKQWSDNQQEAAIGTLRELIKNYADHPAVPSAKASLAAKLMLVGKDADAKNLFQEIAGDPAAAHLAPYALVSLGDIAFAAGETDKAETFYKKAQSGFPGNMLANAAVDRIAALKAKPPVEIEPPPAPPTEAGKPDAKTPALEIQPANSGLQIEEVSEENSPSQTEEGP
ncbi:MAG: tetratricopeptide repeat protein [Verrucomicrobiota bacterium]